MPVHRGPECCQQVLYMVDPLDEICSQSIVDYDGKKLVDINKAGSRPIYCCHVCGDGDETDDTMPATTPPPLPLL